MNRHPQSMRAANIWNMGIEDPLPRDARAIDEEIEEARQELRNIIRRRRLIFLAYGAVLAIEAIFIFFAAITDDPHQDWVSIAVPYGLFVMLPASVSLGVGVSAEANNQTFDIARASVIERSMDLQRLEIARRELLIGAAGGQAATYARYREAMPTLVARYRSQANRYRTAHNSLQAFVILASLGTSAITGLLEVSHSVRAWTVVLTLGIAVSSSMGAYFRLQERGSQLQKTADLIEIEFRAVELGIKDYCDLNRMEALRKFVEKVEELRSEHMTRQRQLNEPANLRHLDSSSVAFDRFRPA
jgi:hypothetical protein